MAISLTDSAADRVRTFLASRGSGLGLRLSVRKTGCSGFAYVVNYADDTRPDDVVFEDHGVKVFVDPQSLELIDGTTVDFVKHGLNEAFRFHNPNVKGECGCGVSFSVCVGWRRPPVRGRLPSPARGPELRFFPVFSRGFIEWRSSAPCPSSSPTA
jgi:iron-sulfur cluster assembly protein